MNGKLVPESLQLPTTETLPISQITTLPQPPRNPDYPYNKNLQNILAGKQLLLEEIPFPLHEIQAHYENGYLYYRKSITMEITNILVYAVEIRKVITLLYFHVQDAVKPVCIAENAS